MMTQVNLYFGAAALTLVGLVLAGGLIYVLLPIPRIADALERIANLLDDAVVKEDDDKEDE